MADKKLHVSIEILFGAIIGAFAGYFLGEWFEGEVVTWAAVGAVVIASTVWLLGIRVLDTLIEVVDWLSILKR